MNLSEFFGIQPKTKEVLNSLDIGMEAIATDLNTILNDLVTLKGYTDTLENGHISLDNLIDSIIVYLERLEDHNHNNQYVYPTLADPPQLVSGTGKWALGNFVELIPANTINAPFDLHYFNTGIGSLVGTYEVHLFSGVIGNEVNFAKFRFARLSNQTGAHPFPIMTPVFPANTRISGKLAVNAVTQETLLCSLAYHDY